MKPIRILLLCVALAMPAAALARSAKAVRAFRALHECPATGKHGGPCPGFVVDHIIPLCLHGPDHPDNMQWQTVAAAKAKDVEEHRQCRAARRVGGTAGVPKTQAAPQGP